MKLLRMTVEDWLKIPDNPIQRDTHRHAEKARKRHLSKADETHAMVAAAVMPDGSVYKVDGHTRAHLWATGELQRPDQLTVVMHSAASTDRLIELYRLYDNPTAAEDSRDRLSGAYRLHGIVSDSWLLTRGGMTSALKFISGAAEHRFSIVQMVGEWKTEILMLNEEPFGQGNCPTAVLIAALLTIRRHSSPAHAFWNVYANGLGSKVLGAADGAHELDRLVREASARRMLGSSHTCEVAGKAISCCEAWIRDQKYTNGAKATDVFEYMRRMGLRTADTKQKRANYAAKRVAKRGGA